MMRPNSRNNVTNQASGGSKSHYLEQENDRMVEELRSKASALKQTVDSLSLAFLKGFSLFSSPDARANRNNPSKRQYFAVYIPGKNSLNDGRVPDDGSRCKESFGFVCETLEEAAGLVKLYKDAGARFKIFNSLADAEIYIKCGRSLTPSTPKRINLLPRSKSAQYVQPSIASPCEEKPSPYRSLDRSELNSFRHAIEKKDEMFFREKIEENPRYLINFNNDTPTILMEGYRYNPMHIAAKSNNLALCKLIMELLSDVEFVRKLYPDDSPETLERRRMYLYDMYLNMPEKGFFETPLHFAAKNGYEELVKFFLSVPDCQKNQKNKYGQTPTDLRRSVLEKTKLSQTPTSTKVPAIVIDEDNDVASRTAALVRTKLSFDEDEDGDEQFFDTSSDFVQ